MMKEPSQPTRTPWTEKVMPIAAIVIAAASLLVAAYQGKVMRETADATVWPYVSLDVGNGDGAVTEQLYMKLVNSGVGPARLESFQLFLNGKPMTSLDHLVETCCSAEAEQVETASFGDFVSGVAPTVIGSKDALPIFTWKRSEESAAVWDKLDQLRDEGGVTFKSCYCSVFDSCWESNFTSTKPKHVNQCPTDVVQFQSNVE